mmetsp:Transcript_73816/g.210537  ORF Transcript_73816/g.210537 Transcript_73816/m.210537 type:complete len:215 (+) Transcript_73816:526-1170(+)
MLSLKRRSITALMPSTQATVSSRSRQSSLMHAPRMVSRLSARLLRILKGLLTRPPPALWPSRPKCRSCPVPTTPLSSSPRPRNSLTSSAFQSLSKRPWAVVVRVCVLCAMKRICSPFSSPRRVRRRRHSVTDRASWNATWSHRVTLRCRSLAMARATRFTSGSVTAPCSAATRRSLRLRLHGTCLLSCARSSKMMLYALRHRLTTSMLVQLSSL